MDDNHTVQIIQVDFMSFNIPESNSIPESGFKIELKHVALVIDFQIVYDFNYGSKHANKYSYDEFLAKYEQSTHDFIDEKLHTTKEYEVLIQRIERWNNQYDLVLCNCFSFALFCFYGKGKLQKYADIPIRKFYYDHNDIALPIIKFFSSSKNNDYSYINFKQVINSRKYQIVAISNKISNSIDQ